MEEKKEKLYSTSSAYSLVTESIYFSEYKYYIDNKHIPNGAQIPRYHSSVKFCVSCSNSSGLLLQYHKKQNSYHWFLNILIEGIPSYAQNHFMHISISNTGPSIVYTSRDIRWKAFNYLLRKVSCKKFIKCKVWVTLCKLRI